MATYELHGERASETGRSEYPHFTAAELAPRAIRFSGLKASEAEGAAREDIAIVGPDQQARLTEPHSFRIGVVRQAPGGSGGHQSADAQVFVVHAGQWRFDLGETGEEAQLYLSPGDVISLPRGTFHGFTNVGTAPGVLWSVQGGDSPADVERAAPGAIRHWTNDEAAALVVRDAPGRDLKEIVAPGAAIGWAHGFLLSRIDRGEGEAWDSLATPSPHVLWCHRGSADISAKDGLIELGEGDTFSVPAGFNARITTTEGAVLFKVERFDDERLQQAVPQPGKAQQTEDVRARQAA